MASIPVSTVPLATTNLIAAIASQPQCQSPPGIAFGIVRGIPLPQQPLDEMILVAQEVRRDTIVQAIVGGGGPLFLREEYRIPVEIGVFRGGDAQLEAETRIYALVGAVETAVRQDLSLGGAVLTAHPDTATITADWDEQGRRYVAAMEIRCVASI